MEMQIFENNQFGSIRTLVNEDGTVLFCGSDVAKALGYVRPAEAVKKHAKGTLKRRILTGGGKQTLSFIPEPDVYRLIFRSKLPSAEQFEKWVVETVLPTLRKCGAYITPEVLSKMEKSSEFTAQLVRLLKQEQEKSDSLQNQMSEMTLKCEYFDKLVDTDTLTNIRQTAKELHIPEKLFTYLLVEMGFAYRAKKHLLMPYAFMVTSGFAELKEYTNGKHGGVYMLFTPVGRLYLARKITRRLAVKELEVHDE